MGRVGGGTMWNGILKPYAGTGEDDTSRPVNFSNADTYFKVEDTRIWLRDTPWPGEQQVEIMLRIYGFGIHC